MTDEDVGKTGRSARRAHRDSAFELAFGQRIRAVRVAAKMSQGALGEAAGISFQQIQKYELGKDRISVGTLQLLADALGVHPGSFFGDQVPVQSSTVRELREAQRIGSRVLAVRDPAIVQKLMGLIDVLAKSQEGATFTNGYPHAHDDPEMLS